jgi:hypothetical protein
VCALRHAWLPIGRRQAAPLQNPVWAQRDSTGSGGLRLARMRHASLRSRATVCSTPTSADFGVQDIRANGQTALNMNQSSSSLRMGNRGQFCSFPSAVLSSQIRRGGLAFSPHIRRTTANDATAWSTHGHSSGENCEICGLGAPFDFPPQCGGFRSLSGGAVCFAAATTNWFRTLSQNPTNP